MLQSNCSVEILLKENGVENDMVGVNRHTQLADMWVCTW